MAVKYQLMIDPTPSGWAYGFPKALPDEALVHGDKAYDMFINPSFDLTKWVVEQGYPEEHFEYYRLFPQEIKDEAAEKMGDYIYPGNDCQE